MENLRIRTIGALLGVLLIVIYLVPSFVNLGNSWWPTKNKLNYGLDIQGGLHLVMGVNVDEVTSLATTRLANSLDAEFIEDGLTGIKSSVRDGAKGEIVISYPSSAETASKIKNRIETSHIGVLQVLENSETQTVVRYFDAYLLDQNKKVIGQAIETIRNRIDEFGVAEPSISQQGSDRVVVQLPGMADAEKAKQLISTAAKLDFMMVDGAASNTVGLLVDEAEKAGGYTLQSIGSYFNYVKRLNEDLKGKLPADTMVLFEKAPNATSMDIGKIPLVVSTTTGLGGDGLDSAFVSYGQYGEAQVALRFNPAGAVKFKQITTEGVGKRMAIVLDQVVKSAPNIQTAIGGGEAVITLGSGDPQAQMDEATLISTALRAGSLPARLEQLEERRVGPSLGADSIKSAVQASYAGAIIIILFMLFRYKGMGVITNISLILNIAAVIALLSMIGATLTLPGIAGIALTVGFAVDANVLINERIREELAKGGSFIFAAKEGYRLALSAILDANITTAATAMILLFFGTGPVKGFAVTLLIGIATTMFFNVFTSKVMLDIGIHKFGLKKLSV